MTDLAGRRTMPLAVVSLARLILLSSYPFLQAEVLEPKPTEDPVSQAALFRFQQSSDEMTGQTAWVREIPNWPTPAEQVTAGAVAAVGENQKLLAQPAHAGAQVGALGVGEAAVARRDDDFSHLLHQADGAAERGLGLLHRVTAGLERTLDDSANRRSILPEAFLITDELLITTRRILEGFIIKRAAINRNLEKYGF